MNEKNITKEINKFSVRIKNETHYRYKDNQNIFLIIYLSQRKYILRIMVESV